MTKERTKSEATKINATQSPHYPIVNVVASMLEFLQGGNAPSPKERHRPSSGLPSVKQRSSLTGT